MNTINVTKISLYVNQILVSATELTIHSVYQTTVNIISEKNELFALQSPTSPMSPLSIILDAPISWHVQPGEKILYKNNSLLFSKGRINIDAPTVFDPLIQESDIKANTLDTIKKLEAILSKSNVSGFTKILFSDDTNELYYMTARNILEASKNNGDSSKLFGLIGMGGGLTPGGDDFLCGLIAAEKLCKKDLFSKKLYAYIQENPNLTNDISKAFLVCATKGMFSQAVKDLFKNADIQKICNDFKKIGHSSGFDTLCGIYWRLKFLEDLL